MYFMTSRKLLNTHKGKVRDSYAQEKASKQRDAAKFCWVVMTYEGGNRLFLIFVWPPTREGTVLYPAELIFVSNGFVLVQVMFSRRSRVAPLLLKTEILLASHRPAHWPRRYTWLLPRRLLWPARSRKKHFPMVVVVPVVLSGAQRKSIWVRVVDPAQGPFNKFS